MFGEWGEAEQGVGVEVADEGLDCCETDGGRGGGVVGGNIEGAAHEGGEGDEVLFGGLLGRDEVVPFDGEGVGEVRLGEGEADDGFGGRVAEGAGVEVDFEGAWG